MRLIDADAIPWTDLNADIPNTDIKILITFADKVNRMPTIEERKKGRWEWVSSTYDRTPCEKRFMCSSCHHATITHDSDPWEKYCPNCGARMEE